MSAMTFWYVLIGMELFLQVQTDVNGTCEMIQITDHIPLFRSFAVHEPEASLINTAQRTIQGVVEMVRPSLANVPQIIGYNSSISPSTMTYHEKKILGAPIGLGEESCVLFTGMRLTGRLFILIFRPFNPRNPYALHLSRQTAVKGVWGGRMLHCEIRDPLVQ